jgi:hypothetical protein
MFASPKHPSPPDRYIPELVNEEKVSTSCAAPFGEDIMASARATAIAPGTVSAFRRITGTTA